MRYLFILLLLFTFLHADRISLNTMKNEKRVAYVIGNGDYDESQIDDATENAQKMKAFLKKHGFEVTYKEDASKRDIIKGLRSFNSDMQAKGVALFYFSGHMIQVKGKNYLIPIEASIESDYHVLYEAIELDAIVGKMHKVGNRLNIIVIDSAYENPFGDRFRAKKEGLASLQADSNTDIILSAKPNSIRKPYPFTQKLVQILSLKGLSNKEGFQTFKQRLKHPYPQVSDQAFFFNLPDKLEDKEEKLWKTTLGAGSLAAYTGYLKKYPNGKYAEQASLDIAEIRLKADENLKRQKVLEQKSIRETEEKEASEALKKEQKEREMAERLKNEAEEKARKEAALAAALEEEKRFARENARFVEPVMVLIKAGSFQMGSDQGDEDEAPRHKVTIKNDFYIGRYEVTNVEYIEFAQATKRKRMIPPNWTTDMQPAVAVSWDDATAYAAWLSDLTGKRYRLPSESEWEYAARATSETRYYWGDRDTSHRKDAWRKEYPDNAHDYAWIKTNAQNVTQKVGSKKPNAWGLFDIIGNVWEWCSDSYTENYNTAAHEESLKVIRGGSWFSTPEEITLSHRGSNVNDFTSYSIGFRLVREK